MLEQLDEGRIPFIGTDHAPHAREEKEKSYDEAPSGFPGFETYPLFILNRVCQYKLSLEKFVRMASENPADHFRLEKKGYIREGYDADLIIVDKIPEYQIKSESFHTKARYTPFENFPTVVQIWKVFIGGQEVGEDVSNLKGKIIKRAA